MLCLFNTISYAEEDDNKEDKNSVFDLSEEQDMISELGIPTMSSVFDLSEKADGLWDAEEYKNAADAYATLAEQANWLANILSAGLEPYYSADYDDRKDFSPQKIDISDLVVYETASNTFKSERNRAMLYEGLCYYNIGDYEMALPLLIKALDIIEITDEENWELGMQALYSIVGFDSN